MDHKRLRQWHRENPNVSKQMSPKTDRSIDQPSHSSEKSLPISPHQLPVIPDTQFPESEDNQEYYMHPGLPPSSSSLSSLSETKTPSV